MAYKTINTKGFALKYGIGIAVACIAFFLIMGLFNLHFEVQLSLINAVIVALGIFFVIRNYRKAKDQNNERLQYLEGLGLGFLTSLVAAILVAGFVLLYALFISDNFLDQTNANEFLGEELSYFSMVGYVLIEVLISGGIAGFVFMQLYKPANHKITA